MLVLTELVQNALEHAFPDGADGRGHGLGAPRARGQLVLCIDDDGRGLPTDFARGDGEQLGLQIVRTLVSAELDGTVEFRAAREGPGTSPWSGCRSARRPRVGG